MPTQMQIAVEQAAFLETAVDVTENHDEIFGRCATILSEDGVSGTMDKALVTNHTITHTHAHTHTHPSIAQ